MIHFSIKALFLLFWVSTIQGQAFVFDHYGPQQGLYSSQVLCITKSNEGYVWIGTESGLVRYDSHTFVTYNSRNTEGLNFDYVNKLIKDKRGDLWLTSGRELCIFNPSTKLAIEIKFPDAFNSNLQISGLDYDIQNDCVWIGTNKGLFYSQGGRRQLYFESLQEVNSKYGISKIIVDEHGNIWIINTYGIHRYDIDQCKVLITKRKGSEQSIDEDEGFLSAFLEGDSILWVGGWIHGLTKYNILNGQQKSYEWSNPELKQNGIYFITKQKDKPNDLWLGTTDGLLKFDIHTEKFRSFNTEEIFNPNNVSGPCFTIFEEEGRGLWIGTLRGLHKLDFNKNFLKFLEIKLENEKGLKDIPTFWFEKNSKNTDSIVWFALEYGGIFRFDLVNRKFLKIPQLIYPFCKDNTGIQSIYLSNNNVLWISSEKHGITVYDINQNVLIKTQSSLSSKDKMAILTIEEDRKGTLWLGGVTSLFSFNKEEGQIEKCVELDSLAKSKGLKLVPYKFTISLDNTIWIVAKNSNNNLEILVQYYPDSNELRIFPLKKEEEKIRISHIQQIKSLDSSKIIVTSFGESAIIKSTEDSFNIEYIQTIRKKEATNLRSIIIGDGNVYFSSGFGIMIYNILNKSITELQSYNSNIGGCVQPSSSYSEQSKTLYIGQNEGVYYFQPKSKLNFNSASPIISNYKIENFNSTEQLNNLDRIELNYDQNNLYFEFTNFDFTNSEQNTYFYKLKTGDLEWNLCNENKLPLNQLTWGDYQLQVRSFNSYGFQSVEDFQLFIQIKPPFFRTGWFNLLILSFITSIIYGLFKYRDHQRQKLNQLRISIARDLHDDMGSQLSQIKIISEMEAIKDTQNLVFPKMVSKLSEVMSSMSEIVWSINPKNDTLDNLAYKIQEYAIDILEPLDIELEFDIDNFDSKSKLSLDERRNIYLIFKESINNISKYAMAKKVNICIRSEGTMLKCQIKDDGIGFDPNLISKGNGLLNMKNRANSLGCEIVISSSEKGTQILFEIKLKRRSLL